MRLTTRIGIMLISSSLLLSGCSEHKDFSINSPAQQSKRPHLLVARTNPLQTYIQSNWTSSDPTWVGGSHFENIKIYGHSYAVVGATDGAFINDHFDMYMGGGDDVRDGSNGTLLYLGEAANVPHVRNGYPYPRTSPSWDSLQVNTFLATANPNNYKFDDLLLHFKVNTTTYVQHPGLGWNPSDDGNNDGCRDSTSSDPNRTAPCIWDSRIRNYVPVRWPMSYPASQAYIDFRTFYAEYDWNNLHIEGFHFDEVSYQNQNVSMGNSIEYWGQDPADSSFDYIADKYRFVPAVMSQVESNLGGDPIVSISNCVSGTYICHAQDGSPHAVQHDLAQGNLENIFLENWMTSFGDANIGNRSEMLDCPLTDFLEQGKGIAFTYREDNSMGRLFSLCMFYMINHQMAFYYYTKQSHNGVGAEAGQWNKWVEYNIGQPMVNDLSLSDFQSNSSTDKFFVFASGANYQVLGREYYRDSDGAIILVLAKLMAYGQTAGSINDTISLGGNYRIVLQNFALSSQVSSVTLKNNEGVILVRGGTGNGHGGCHCELGN